jgi:hypothetical protein
MASSTLVGSTTSGEDETSGEAEEEAEEEQYTEDEEEEAPPEQCTELLDEIELRELGVLRRMAQKGADPTELRKKVQNLKASPHRQSKLKDLRRNMKRTRDKEPTLWVEVDDGGCPTGARRPDWLTKLRGYSRDLDWSVDNFKLHPRVLLLAIKDKMASQFEYRGGLGDVPEDVFFQELRQQMRTKRANMKRLLDKGETLPGYVKKEHVENFKKLIARTDKIAEAERMKNVRQVVQNVSHSGRSEGEVRSRLVSDLHQLVIIFILFFGFFCIIQLCTIINRCSYLWG